MADELPQTVLGSLKTAFDPRVGKGMPEKGLPYLVSVLSVVWVALVAADVLPLQKWVPVVSVALGALNGFYVRHAGAPTA